MWTYKDNEFVKLYRKILNWEWYSDIHTMKILYHCILKANWRAGVWHGIHYEAGEFVTSLNSLSVQNGMTIREVRTALQHLIESEFITSRTTDKVTGRKLNKNRIISVVKWDKYQGNDKQNDKQNGRQVTNKRQASDKQATNKRQQIEEYIEYKEYIEEKEKKEKESPSLAAPLEGGAAQSEENRPYDPERDYMGTEAIMRMAEEYKREIGMI